MDYSVISKSAIVSIHDIERNNTFGTRFLWCDDSVIAVEPVRSNTNTMLPINDINCIVIIHDYYNHKQYSVSKPVMSDIVNGVQYIKYREITEAEERRLVPRFELDEECEIRVDGGFTGCVIADISASGMKFIIPDKIINYKDQRIKYKFRSKYDGLEHVGHANIMRLQHTSKDTIIGCKLSRVYFDIINLIASMSLSHIID